MCVCVCVRVRARVRACVRACVCVRACRVLLTTPADRVRVRSRTNFGGEMPERG